MPPLWSYASPQSPPTPTEAHHPPTPPGHPNSPSSLPPLTLSSVLPLLTAFLSPCPSNPTPPLVKITCQKCEWDPSPALVGPLVPSRHSQVAARWRGPRPPRPTLHSPLTSDAGSAHSPSSGSTCESKCRCPCLKGQILIRETGSGQQGRSVRPACAETTVCRGWAHTGDRLGSPPAQERVLKEEGTWTLRVRTLVQGTWNGTRGF